MKMKREGKPKMQSKYLTVEEMLNEMYTIYGADTDEKKSKISQAVTAAAASYSVTIHQYLEKYFSERAKDDKPTEKIEVVKPPKKIVEPPEVLPWKLKSDLMSRGQTSLLPTGYEQPEVRYTPHVKAVIDYLVEINSKEVGWLGTVQREGNIFTIDQIYVPAQEVSAVETLIDHQAMTALWEEIFNAGGDPGTLYYWGHSHVNMGVSPSGQDEYQVNRFLRGCPMFIRGIYNKRGDAKVDVYDVENRIVSQCVPNYVEYSLTAEERKQVKALVDTNVRSPVWNLQQNRGYSKGPLRNPPILGASQYTGLDLLDDEAYNEALKDPFFMGGSIL